MENLYPIKKGVDPDSEELEKELCERWGISSLNLIGKYSKGANSNYDRFIDLRNMDFEMLDYPYPVNIKGWIYSIPRKDLEEGKYYKIECELSPFNIRRYFKNPYLLIVKSDVLPIELKPREFIENQFNLFALASNKITGYISKSIKTITFEINKQPETFVYELLQNANDYPNTERKVNVHFEIFEEYLLFSHNGAPFQFKNVNALCGINEGDKRDNKEAIGFKGIGFKSVFKDNNYVILNSGGFLFRFDQSYFHKNPKKPWQLIPIWTEKEELAPKLKNKNIWQMPVSFIFRPKNKDVLYNRIDQHPSYTEIFKSVFSDEQVLLFLPFVFSVTVKINTEPSLICQKTGRWWLKSYDTEVDDAVTKWLNNEIEKNENEKIPEKYLELSRVKISFATQRAYNRILKVKNARIFTYLPTKIDLRFPFLINADFIPDGSREQFHDLRWNSYLMKEVGYKFVNWLNDIGRYKWKDEKNGKRIMFKADYVSLIPDFEYCLSTQDGYNNKLILSFKTGFDQAILEIPFIPDTNHNLQKLENILLDKTGFVSLVGSDLFREWTEFDEVLIHPDLSKDPTIERLIKEYELGRKFTFDDFTEILETDGFQTWLLDTKNNIRFLKWLTSEKKLSKIEDKPVFLNQIGELKKSVEIFDDVSKDIDLIYWLNPDYLYPEVKETMMKIEAFRKWADDNFRIYTVKDFLEEEILDRIDELKDLYIEKPKNQLLFRYIFRYKDQIDSDLSKRVKKLELLDKSGELIPSLEEFIFFDHAELQQIAKTCILPSHLYYIIDDGYCTHESEKEKWEEFWKEFGVMDYEASYLIRDIILNEHESDVRDHLDSREKNIDFFRFVFQHEQEPEYLSKFSSFSVLDSKDAFISLDKTIYLPDDNLIEITAQKWMPEDLYFILSESYFEEASYSEEWKLFWEKIGIKSYNKADFVNEIVLDNTSKINETLQEKEANRDFYRYIFKNRQSLKKDNFKSLSSLYVLLNDNESFVSLDETIYLQDESLSEISSQKWMPEGFYHVLSDSYLLSPADKGEWLKFWNDTGIQTFIERDFIEHIVIEHLDEIDKLLNEKEANLSFYRYIFKNRSNLRQNDFEKLKSRYILCYEGIIGSINDSEIPLYAPNKELKSIMVSGFLPAGIFTMISDEFCEKIANKKAWEEFWVNTQCFGIPEFHPGDLFNNIIIPNQTEIDLHQKLTTDTTIQFWDYLCKHTRKQDDSKILGNFHVLLKYEVDETSYSKLNQCYLSDEYLPSPFESTVRKYKPENLQFISPQYLKNSSKSLADWGEFFKKCGVKHDYIDLVIEDILPELASREDPSNDDEVKLIFTHREEIKEKGRIEDLKKLKVRTNTGEFLPVTDCFVGDDYTGKKVCLKTLPSIILPRQITVDYLPENYKDEDRLNWLAFWKLLIDDENILEEGDRVYSNKIEYLVKEQDNDIIRAQHLDHFKDLVKCFGSKTSIGTEDIKQLEKWKLLSKSDEHEYCLAQNMYFPNLFQPDFDFEKLGITEDLTYVSEQYNKYPGAKDFLYQLGVCGEFKVEHLNLLATFEVVHAFWLDIINGKLEFDNFASRLNRNASIIPTKGKELKCPSDLYSWDLKILS
jgi:hypothetical protein